MIENMSQIRFDELMKLRKHFLDEDIRWPSPGEKISFGLLDQSNHEKFFLDVDRNGTIELRKTKLQNRHSYSILVRLEVEGPPHINPDGEKIGRNHIHIYREGYGDRWAFELNSFQGANFGLCRCFDDYASEFCNYCNIELPSVQTVI